MTHGVPKGVHYVARFAFQPAPAPKGYTTPGWYFEALGTLRGPYATCEEAIEKQKEST